MRAFLLPALLASAPAWAETAQPVPSAILAAGMDAEEAEAFRLAVAQCWNLAGLSPAALAERATVALRFDAEGRPDAASIRLISAESAGPAREQLFESARRALLRCGHDGLPLPAALLQAGGRAELTFDPSGAALR